MRPPPDARVNPPGSDPVLNAADQSDKLLAPVTVGGLVMPVLATGKTQTPVGAVNNNTLIWIGLGLAAYFLLKSK